jgi:hypothetical protein
MASESCLLFLALVFLTINSSTMAIPYNSESVVICGASEVESSIAKMVFGKMSVLIVWTQRSTMKVLGLIVFKPNYKSNATSCAP